MRKYSSRILLGLTCAWLLAACSQENGQRGAMNEPVEPAPCRLKMGWDPWEPYQYRNARGDIAGMDVEIATAAATRSGCEIAFVEGEWMSLVEQLRDGEIGLLAGATPTPGREAFATFTTPYRSESFVVYTLAGNDRLRDARELDELRTNHARLGTVAEYYYGHEITELLNALFETGNLREAVLAEMNYQRLLNGDVDAFIEDPFVASSILRGRGLEGRIVPTGIRVQAQDVAFMLSRTGVSEDEANRFGGALEAMAASGELEEIVSRYRVSPVDAP